MNNSYIDSMEKDRQFVKDYLNKIYPQLVINCKKTCGAGYSQWGDDLLSISIQFFLEKPIEVQLEAIENNKCENFITFIMAMQLKSSSSYFYTRYRKELYASRELITDLNYGRIQPYSIHEKEDMLTCLEECIEEMDPEFKIIFFEKVYDGVSLRDLSHKYDISIHNLTIKLNEQHNNIKNKCECYL